ncbi:MAG: BPTI/Kunitz-type proteinase inhibitor domain-containing protein [Syntrophaceae bacterium]|nr:BPTI/Kunitz domain-containing protein [Deltaproteobacteria bacterium]
MCEQNKYYYDSGSKTCKKFIWGGCDGVLPFETEEECNQSCGNERKDK